MRILLITQWFEPEPVLKGITFAKALKEHGHEVEVLTGFPNYPTGRVYPGYKVRLYQKELIDGISVIRIPLYPSHDNSAVGRIANYVSFSFSASVLGPWLIRRPDLIYVYHPPPTTYLPAFICKLLYRIPVVYDIQDFWPETLAATGMFNNKLGLKMVDVYCRLSYKAATKIVVLSPGFKKKLIQKHVPEDKIEVIYNWFDEKKLAHTSEMNELPEILTRTDTFKVLFAGNMGKAQALDTVLRAAMRLKETTFQIDFIFIGGGVDVDELKLRSSQMELTNVHFLPPVPQTEVGLVLNAADVLLVHLKEDPLFRITIPSKIQAYLAVGKPILCAVPGDASNLVTNAKAGLACPSEDPDRLAQTVLEFLKMPTSQRAEMGNSGKDYYDNNICMKAGVEHFHKLFNELVS